MYKNFPPLPPSAITFMNNKKKSDTEEGEVATFHVCVCVRRLFVFNLHGLNGEGGASVCASLCRSAAPLRRQMARQACQSVFSGEFLTCACHDLFNRWP